MRHRRQDGVRHVRRGSGREAMLADTGSVGFRLLGPISAVRGQVTVDIGSPKQRVVLAALLLDHGRVVSVDQLVEGVWGEHPPSRARKAIQVYVCNLRRALPDVALHGRRPGYLFDGDPDQIDLQRFRRLVSQATQSDGKVARRLLSEALALWRGEPLGGAADAPLVRTLAPALLEERISALERRVELDLDAGVHTEVIGELLATTRTQPLREGPYRLLMLALYRAGRQAEALEVFHRARTVFREELGTEPGPPLRQLHQRLLVMAPDTDDGPVMAVPAELPADLPDFTGHDRLIEDFVAAYDRTTGEPSRPVAITAIDGMAGVGKTTLAVHLGHRLSARFPDGQFFIDLHGFTEGPAPVSPAHALDRLLRSVGVPAEQLPQTVEDRTVLWRTRVADRRMLVMLDNAADEAQIAPLLPNGPGCLVIVTSRRRLIGLDQARPVSLDILPAADAMTLFRRIVGPQRLAGTAPARLREVVELCGRLPLGVRIVATRLRARSTWTVDYLVDRLRDERSRLAELTLGQRGVAAAFQMSYQHLPADRQRLFRLLGLAAGTEIDQYVAAALMDAAAAPTERLLEDLLDAHLLTQPGPGRYRFHDLLRIYAVEVANREEAEPDRRAAVGRLLGYYLNAASQAADLFAPHERDRRPAVSLATMAGPGPGQATVRSGWGH